MWLFISEQLFPHFVEYETEAIGFTFYLYGFVSDAILIRSFRFNPLLTTRSQC